MIFLYSDPEAWHDNGDVQEMEKDCDDGNCDRKVFFSEKKTALNFLKNLKLS